MCRKPQLLSSPRGGVAFCKIDHLAEKELQCVRPENMNNGFEGLAE